MLIALLGFLALALAPMATPAAAMAVGGERCQAMVVHHQNQDSGHQPGMHLGCCLALPATLPPTFSEGGPSLERGKVQALGQPILAGIVPEADYPPPRAV